MIQRSNTPSRLVRPQGNRANLQRQSKAQVTLVRAPGAEPAEPAKATQPPADRRWRRRRNTH